MLSPHICLGMPEDAMKPFSELVRIFHSVYSVAESMNNVPIERFHPHPPPAARQERKI